MNLSIIYKTLVINNIFYVVLILLTFLYAANGHFYWWGWPAMACLIVMVLSLKINQILITPLFITIILYTVIMLFNIFFINPAFHIESLLFLGFLIFAYLLGRGMNEDDMKTFNKVVIFLFCCLAVWGIIQYLTGIGFIDYKGSLRQSNTVFTTPNSFAATLNLCLIPLIITRIYHPNKKHIDYIIFLLFLALLTTQSRGGAIAFLGGLGFGVFILLLLREKVFNLSNFAFLLKILGLIIIFTLYHNHVMKHSLIDRAELKSEVTTQNQNSNVVENRTSLTSIEHRLHHYKIAWQQFKQRPLLGSGYFNYKYYLNRDNPYDITTQYGTTHFVHNDYLQHLLETGIVGFIALIFIIATFYLQAYRSVIQSQGEDKIYYIAVIAAASNFYLFALGDFVFYLPAINLFFGVMLGYFDRVSATYNSITAFGQALHSNLQIKIPIRIFIAICLSTVFISPAVARHYASVTAEATDKHQYSLAFKSVKKAQKLAPYEADYIYMEAFIWILAAELENSKEHANMADDLLVKAIHKNPMKKHILLKRSILHRDYPHLLDNPVDLDVVLKWQEEVLDWENEARNNASQKEYINTLKKAGKIEEAIKHSVALNKELLQNQNIKTILKKALNPD